MPSYRNLFIAVLSLLLPAHSHGQKQRGGQYEDLDLYRALLEVEKRDGTYHKTLARWQDSRPDQGGQPPASFAIKDSGLKAKYRSVVSMPEDTTEDVRAKTDALMSLSGRAADKKETPLQTDCLFRAFALAFRGKPQDYDRAFYLGFLLEEKLPQVSESDYPAKRQAYYKLGEAYYLFLDYHKSINLLEKALAPVPLAFDDRANLDALNILGICYASIGRMDTSDEYFRATLSSDNVVFNRPVYNAYALAHLGCNAMLTGQYDKAIALSRAVWPVLREETQDYGHLAGICYCRARSYLEKGDFKQASVWIDSLVFLARQDQYDPAKRIRQAHLLRADYHAAMGDARQARLYNDSLVGVYRTGEEQHASQYIARAAERYNREKITAQFERPHASGNRLVILALAALCGLAPAFVILSLYRRKNAAYKALMQKARRWEHENQPSRLSMPATGANGEREKEAPTQEDERIMSLIREELSARYAYREESLTAEMLADRLGIPRKAFSRAINRTSGGNFNHYVNGLRTREAIRRMEGKGRRDIHIDEVYESAGFRSRASFYRAFKQFTGLSPVEFLNNG